jgi:acetyl-CoA decarbonylase/synthase complex subunit gamma
LSIHPRLEQHFVTGILEKAPVGKVPQISSSLTWWDHLGTFKAHWGVGRMDYKIDPGLYALGMPYEESPVLVTANYKMSFDRLREAMPGRNAWVLVLDTKGINVWCAAGKRTFGTKELVERIASSRLGEVVSHRDPILPQLGAPGVSAHLVRKLSGFKVHYGPVCASYLPAFLDAGLKATLAMRRKTFTIWERMVLIPIDLIAALKTALFIVPAIFIMGGLSGHAGFWSNAINNGGFAVAAFLSAIIAGSVLFPLLLPFLPGRSFSLKGFILGFIVAVIAVSVKFPIVSWAYKLDALSWLFLIPAITAYLAMNFTGASTITSLSGVKKEMRWAVPAEAGTALAGLILWVFSIIVS